MTYIIVAAGMGTRLAPYTLDCPKALYRLDENTTVLGRLAANLRSADKDAEIVVCLGFCAERIKKEIPGVTTVWNPFYAVTNSLSTLYFAREYLDREQVMIIDGDIVVEDRLVREVYCTPVTRPTALVDSSRASCGDYCVELSKDGTVIAMSKNLTRPSAEYANATKLDRRTALLLRDKMEAMLHAGRINEWMETALAQLVFEDGLKLCHKDIAGYRWSEIDDVSELATAREIHESDPINA